MRESLNKIELYKRSILKYLCKECTEDQQKFFKRMYSHKNLNLSIDQIVDNMECEKIDWAIKQCEHTINKNNENI